LLIDQLSPKLSAAVGWHQGTTGHPLIDQADVIDTLKNLMVSCGWSVIDYLYARGSLSYPLGLPTVTPPGVGEVITIRTVGCSTSGFFSLSGRQYIGYDPYREAPASGTTCVFFAWGDNAAGTAANIAAAIGTDALFTGSAVLVSGIWNVYATALSPGPELNYTQLAADGRWGLASAIQGGGWVLESQELLDGDGNLQTGSMQVKLYSTIGVNATTTHITEIVWVGVLTPFNDTVPLLSSLDTRVMVSFRESDGSSIPGDGSGYTLVCNPYSFGAFLNGGTGSQIFVAAPYIATEQGFMSKYALMLLYPAFSTRTYWRSATVWLDSAPVTEFGNSGYPKLIMLRAPGTTPLTTITGAPIAANAWVMFDKGTVGYLGIVGHLWDCVAVNDYVSSIVIDGHKYIALARQAGDGGETRSTLAFRTNGN
jgi:hypothetical protein